MKKAGVILLCAVLSCSLCSCAPLDLSELKLDGLSKIKERIEENLGKKAEQTETPGDAGAGLLPELISGLEELPELPELPLEEEAPEEETPSWADELENASSDAGTELKKMLDEDPELQALVEKSILLASAANPDEATNPVRNLSGLYTYLASMKYNGIDPDYLYFLFDQPLDEYKDKGYPYPCLEYCQPVKKWLTNAMKEYKAVVSPESIEGYLPDRIEDKTVYLNLAGNVVGSPVSGTLAEMDIDDGLSSKGQINVWDSINKEYVVDYSNYTGKGCTAVVESEKYGVVSITGERSRHRAILDVSILKPGDKVQEWETLWTYVTGGEAVSFTFEDFIEPSFSENEDRFLRLDVVNYSNDSADFVNLSDIAKDVILDMRYYSTYNFVGDRIDDYNEPIALLTVEAAEAVKAASENLSGSGYRIKVYDAYRPQTAQDRFMSWAADASDVKMKSYFYPGKDKEELLSGNYIRKCSEHTRGSAVAVTLVDMMTGQELDMGGGYDLFADITRSDTTALTAKQTENRAVLSDAMRRVGFEQGNLWYEFKLANEPFADTYFTFRVEKASLKNGNQ